MNVRIFFFLCSASNIIVIWSILQTFPSLVNCVCAQSLLKIMRSCRKIISSFYFVEICVMMNCLFYSLSLRCRYITISGCLQRSTSTKRYLSHFSSLFCTVFIFSLALVRQLPTNDDYILNCTRSDPLTGFHAYFSLIVRAVFHFPPLSWQKRRKMKR